MKTKSIEEIKDFLGKIAQPLGIEIYDVEIKQGKNPSITVYIEKEGGVDLATCEVFHNAIMDPIDQLDPTFGQPYTLNVSSPGADRPFRDEKDFVSHIGKMVEVKVKNSVKGKKSFDGVLLSFDGKAVSVRVDEKNVFTIDLKNLVKMNEYIEFD